MCGFRSPRMSVQDHCRCQDTEKSTALSAGSAHRAEDEEKVVETSADAFRMCRSESVPGKRGSDPPDKAACAADTCKWYPDSDVRGRLEVSLCVESLAMSETARRRSSCSKGSRSSSIAAMTRRASPSITVRISAWRSAWAVSRRCGRRSKTTCRRARSASAIRAGRRTGVRRM